MPLSGSKPWKGGHVGVKEAVFPFARFPGVDTVLGPEMRSTGEVIGLDRSFDIAFAKSQLGAGAKVPTSGAVFVSVREVDKLRVLDAVRLLADMGFKVLATGGTARFLNEKGIRGAANQQGFGRPPACRRRHQERRRAAGVQHHRRRAGAGRFAFAAPRRAAAPSALLYDAGRRAGGRARASGPITPAIWKCAPCRIISCKMAASARELTCAPACTIMTPRGPSRAADAPLGARYAFCPVARFPAEARPQEDLKDLQDGKAAHDRCRICGS